MWNSEWSLKATEYKVPSTFTSRPLIGIPRKQGPKGISVSPQFFLCTFIVAALPPPLHAFVNLPQAKLMVCQADDLGMSFHSVPCRLSVLQHGTDGPWGQTC